MVRPRWQTPVGLGLGNLGRRAREWQLLRASRPFGRGWDRFVALWASLNLLLVVFDISYVPLRNFWLQRHLYLFPGLPLAIPLTVLPDITPLYDPVKGIEPHRDTEQFRKAWQELDLELQRHPPTAPTSRRLLQRQVDLTQRMIEENPFLAANKTGTLEKIKNRLRLRAGGDSAQQAAAQLLRPERLQQQGWDQERRFWQQELLPLVATNYWRSIDETGRPTERFWRLDLVAFQSVFLLDVLLRVLSLRRRLPGLSWRDALLRRWTDLPLLLPFWRLLRIIPVAARLRSSGLLDVEPLRAVISRGIVALLAVELIEVLALQLLDGAQNLVRSPGWRQRLLSLSKAQPVDINDEREVEELLRLWGPLLLGRVLPRLEPELQELATHALRRGLEATAFPQPLQRLQPLLLLERELTRQLAAGLVDGMLDLSRTAAARVGHRDQAASDLIANLLTGFWRELGDAVEDGSSLERSQQLLSDLLEELKLSYLGRLNPAGVDELFEELDQISQRGNRAS